MVLNALLSEILRIRAIRNFVTPEIWKTNERSKWKAWADTEVNLVPQIISLFDLPVVTANPSERITKQYFTETAIIPLS